MSWIRVNSCWIVNHPDYEKDAAKYNEIGHSCLKGTFETIPVQCIQFITS
jgi:hypothetical protein